MGLFECCKNCSSDKRHPGCHSSCDAYLESKQALDHQNKVKREYYATIPRVKTDYLNNPVWKNNKKYY